MSLNPRAEPEPLPQHGNERTSPTIEVAVVLRIVASLLWILWGLKLYQPTFVVSGAPEMGFVYTLGGVLLLIVSGARLPERWALWLDAVLFVGTLVAFAFWTRAAVFGSPAYGTDAVAFAQGAAQVFVGGRNPYGVDLAWALDAFRVLPSYTTNTLDGGFVRNLDYPAGSFLFYVPLLAVGIQAQAAIYVDAIFWIAGMIALWLALPRPYRGVVPIVASLEIFVQYATGGVTDSLMVPFLVAALWRWDRFGDPTERSTARWMGPLALGLACTVKQSAWFLVPMLALGIVMESAIHRRGWKPVVRYAILLAVAFFVPNLPFILWNPTAWFSGVVVPLAGLLVPFGQGFVAFSTYLSAGGGNLFAFTLAGGLMMVAVLAAFMGWYSSLKRLLPALPLVALLLPTRSLNSYFVYAIPGLLVSLTTVAPGRPLDWSGRVWPRPLSRLLASGMGLLACASLAVALLAPAPIVLVPVSQHTTGALQSVDSLTVLATNTTDKDLQPHFAVAIGPYLSSYWIVGEGPATLAAGAEARYVLLAPNTPSMPVLDQQSVLYAMTAKPATISSALLFPATSERTQLSPQAVNQFVPESATVDFSAQLVDRLNSPIHRPGVEISIGQVLYTAEGLFPGQTSINGHPEGQSPVIALTDADGIARFTVRAIQQQPYEVFFQTWISDPFPHG
ncbi:MAG: hypothetical protein ABI880_11680, partial [Acidobacteriota bacterium]